MTRSEIVGANIHKYRTQVGMSQIDFAIAIGRSQTMVSMYEKGTRLPSTQILAKIAKVLGVPFGDLYYAPNEHSDDMTHYFYPDPSISIKRIPVLGDTAAGAPIIANREYDEYIEVPTDGRKFDAAVRVKGDSMAPAYNIGDLALVRYQDDVLDGQIAVICLDDEVTFKRLYHLPNGLMLHSDNPKYKPMMVSADDVPNIHLTGRVVGCIRWEG